MLTRRALLRRSARGLAGAAVMVVVGGTAVSSLAGCTHDVDVPQDLEEGIAAEESLIADYTTVIASLDSSQASVLEHLRGNHVAHLEELRRLAGLTAAKDSPSPSAGHGAGALTAEQVAGLTAGERTAAAAASARCLRTYGEHSGTHAAISACEASHTLVLAALNPGAAQ